MTPMRSNTCPTRACSVVDVTCSSSSQRMGQWLPLVQPSDMKAGRSPRSGSLSNIILYIPRHSLTSFYFVSTAFAKGMCYEPFVKYGNFSGSDSSYGVGAVVEFSCDPGYTLEQGSVVIECVDAQNPQWNETEPACRGERKDSIS